MTIKSAIALSCRSDWASEAERCLQARQGVTLVPDEAESAAWGAREILNLELGLLRLDTSYPQWRGRVRFIGLKSNSVYVARLYRLITGGVTYGA